jgi:hypothetical protein
LSIEATNWALKQRLRLPGEQFLLMLIANAADPTGVAFAWWKGRDHWWTYLVERSRMSKASVFKHLKTLEEEYKLGERVAQPTQDGSYRPVMHLDMAKLVIISELRIEESDDDRTDPSPTVGLAQNSQSNDRTDPSPTVGLAQNSQSNDRTDPSPTVGLHIEDSKTLDSIPPSPPQAGGECVDDEGLEKWITQVRVLYPEPITNVPKLRMAGRVLNDTEREERLTAIKGYAAFIAEKKRAGKPRAVMNADKFVREGFEGFLEGGHKAVEIAEMRQVPLTSPEGRAMVALYAIAGAPLFKFEMGGDLCCNVRGALDAQALALADAPPRQEWALVTGNQAAAWAGFARSAIGKLVLWRDGLRVPWPWPPRKDGSLTGSDATPLPPVAESG